MSERKAMTQSDFQKIDLTEIRALKEKQTVWQRAMSLIHSVYASLTELNIESNDQVLASAKH
jgi:hypothetical protein